MTDLFGSVEKDVFFANLKKSKTGEDCPCCGRFAKFYKYKITKAMVLTMAKCLRRQVETLDGWAHHNSFLAGESRSFYNLKYFGLIEKKNATEGDLEIKRTSGYWCVTQKGREFLHGHKLVPKYAIVFDDKCFGFDGNEVSVFDCYGEHFNYSELMGM